MILSLYFSYADAALQKLSPKSEASGHRKNINLSHRRYLDVK